jgi:hypothetical protein
LLAPEPTLKTMILTQSNGALNRQWPRVDLTSDLVVTFVIDLAQSLRHDLGKFNAQQGFKGEHRLRLLAYRALAVLKGGGGGTFAANLTGEKLVEITLETTDARSAGELEKQLRQETNTLVHWSPQLHKEIGGLFPATLAQEMDRKLELSPRCIQLGRIASLVQARLLDSSTQRVDPLTSRTTPQPPQPVQPAQPAQPEPVDELEQLRRDVPRMKAEYEAKIAEADAEISNPRYARPDHLRDLANQALQAISPWTRRVAIAFPDIDQQAPFRVIHDADRIEREQREEERRQRELAEEEQRKREGR